MDDSSTFCRYLDRMFKLRLPEPLKAQVTAKFLNISNIDELKQLCYDFQNYLIQTYGQHPYFEFN